MYALYVKQILTHINIFKISYFFSLPVSFLLFPCTVSSNTNKNFLLQKKTNKQLGETPRELKQILQDTKCE